MLFKIINENQPNFTTLLNKLIDISEILPIYSAAHMKYYENFYDKKLIENISFLVCDENQALGAFLAHSYEDTLTSKSFSYFGMPTLFVISPNISNDLKLEICELMIRNLNRIGFFSKKIISNYNILLPFNSINTIGSAEIFLKNARNSRVIYERTINLLDDDEIIFSNLSKSVKSAIKKNKEQKSSLTFFDHLSSTSGQISAISVLKKLHFESAGRKTRSDETWEIQLEQLQEGSILVTQGVINDEVVHSSLFLINGKSVFYGVSANKIETRENSISHIFLYKTIIELKKRNYSILFMGQQFESLGRTLNPKEIGIEQFKSFFGGNLKPFLSLSANA